MDVHNWPPRKQRTLANGSNGLNTARGAGIGGLQLLTVGNRSAEEGGESTMFAPRLRPWTPSAPFPAMVRRADEQG